MAVTPTCPFPQVVNNVAGQVLPADTTSKKTIYTAGSNGSILKSLWITSNDTSARNLQFYINVGGGGTDEFMCTITIPITAGTDAATNGVDIMRSSLNTGTAYDAFGNKGLYLKASSTLKMACTTTVTTAKELDANGEVLDY